MIELRDGVGRVTVPVTLMNARALLEAGRSALRAGEETTFDLSGVEQADSAAIALMMGLVRDARAQGATVRFTHIPAGVLSLAELYGVTSLLPLA